MSKSDTAKTAPVQVFRQFAWNLAGTLAAQKAGGGDRPKGQGQPGGKR